MPSGNLVHKVGPEQSTENCFICTLANRLLWWCEALV